MFVFIPLPPFFFVWYGIRQTAMEIMWTVFHAEMFGEARPSVTYIYCLNYNRHTIISMNKYGIKKQQMLMLEETKIGYALLDPIAWRSIAM